MCAPERPAVPPPRPRSRLLPAPAPFPSHARNAGQRRSRLLAMHGPLLGPRAGRVAGPPAGTPRGKLLHAGTGQHRQLPLGGRGHVGADRRVELPQAPRRGGRHSLGGRPHRLPVPGLGLRVQGGRGAAARVQPPGVRVHFGGRRERRVRRRGRRHGQVSGTPGRGGGPGAQRVRGGHGEPLRAAGQPRGPREHGGGRVRRGGVRQGLPGRRGPPGALLLALGHHHLLRLA
mmetsp:Transcript_47810/g.108505  ORF Transcript_47810/g.108505 Transcript_47810/m.108505 type:complete len:231 (-) Transcript_47810:952-1644(-)